MMDEEDKQNLIKLAKGIAIFCLAVIAVYQLLE